MAVNRSVVYEVRGEYGVSFPNLNLLRSSVGLLCSLYVKLVVLVLVLIWLWSSEVVLIWLWWCNWWFMCCLG